MTDERLTIFDPATRLSVVVVDCLQAAGELARAHLSGPVASTYLAQALAGVALLGGETARTDETVTFQLTCPGPLEGVLVECTDRGTLRGYTNKKILGDFDGNTFSDAEVLGATGTVEVIRSVPGTVLSSGATACALTASGGVNALSHALDAYFSQSLQRRVRACVLAQAGDDGVPVSARGVMVECAPDGDVVAFDRVAALFDDGTVARALGAAHLSPRTFLKKIALPQAEIRATAPLAFACRCSAARARDLVAALTPEARAELPDKIDITCHMCGRTWTVPKPSA